MSRLDGLQPEGSSGLECGRFCAAESREVLTMSPHSPGKSLLARPGPWLLWPSLYGAGLVGTSFAIRSAHPLLWFNAVYLSVALSVVAFERLLPYEPLWLEDDGETANNIAHTLLNKGLVQVAAAVITTF